MTPADHFWEIPLLPVPEYPLGHWEQYRPLLRAFPSFRVRSEIYPSSFLIRPNPDLWVFMGSSRPLRAPGDLVLLGIVYPHPPKFQSDPRCEAWHHLAHYCNTTVTSLDECVGQFYAIEDIPARKYVPAFFATRHDALHYRGCLAPLGPKPAGLVNRWTA